MLVTLIILLLLGSFVLGIIGGIQHTRVVSFLFDRGYRVSFVLYFVDKRALREFVQSGKEPEVAAQLPARWKSSFIFGYTSLALALVAVVLMETFYPPKG